MHDESGVRPLWAAEFGAWSHQPLSWRASQSAGARLVPIAVVAAARIAGPAGPADAAGCIVPGALRAGSSLQMAGALLAVPALRHPVVWTGRIGRFAVHPTAVVPAAPAAMSASWHLDLLS